MTTMQVANTTQLATAPQFSFCIDRTYNTVNVIRSFVINYTHTNLNNHSLQVEMYKKYGGTNKTVQVVSLPIPTLSVLTGQIPATGTNGSIACQIKYGGQDTGRFVIYLIDVRTGMISNTQELLIEDCALTGGHRYANTNDIDFNINIYPNPTQNQLTVELPESDNSTIEIFDLQGRQHFNQSFETDKPIIDTSGLPNGMYFVRVRQKGKEVIQKEIILR